MKQKSILFIASLKYGQAYEIPKDLFEDIWQLMELNRNPIYSLYLTDECGVMKCRRKFVNKK